MELLVRYRVVRSNVVQAGHTRFAAELVDQFGLPKKHHVFLVLGCFFLKVNEVAVLQFLLQTFRSSFFSPLKRLARFFPTFENFSKCSTSELLDDLEASFQNFLAFLQRHY